MTQTNIDRIKAYCGRIGALWKRYTHIAGDRAYHGERGGDSEYSVEQESAAYTAANNAIYQASTDLSAAIAEIERLKAEIELSKRSNEQALWEAQSKLQ